MGEFRVVIPTGRYEASAAFYAEVLGWPLVRDWPDPGRGGIFSTGGETVVELLAVADAAPVTGMFCAVRVADATAEASRLVAAGTPLDQPLADQPWGHRNLAVRDPNGVRIVLFEVLA